MKRHIITGGLGFLGSHLALRLARRGDHVAILDLPEADDRLLRSMCRSEEPITPALADPRSGVSAGVVEILPMGTVMEGDRRVFKNGRIVVVRGDAAHGHDLTRAFAALAPLPGISSTDRIWSFACHASPDRYKARPVATLDVCALGTRQAVLLAQQTGATVVLASTSEVYGDPNVHPQPEEYRGNVDPTGPRSMYDEGKRFAEAYLTHALPAQQRRIVRIFNTIGPCSPLDGRMIPSFVRSALTTGTIQVSGSGHQTRTPIYVTDLLDGIEAVSDHGTDGRPYNVGGEDEMTVALIASQVASLLRFTYGREVGIEYGAERCPQDPDRRKPDLSRVRALGWRGPRLLGASAVDRAAAWLLDTAPTWGLPSVGRGISPS